MTTLTLEMPDTVLAALRCAPEELSEEVRLAAAANWYAHGRMSQEIAAQVAGLNRTDFLLALSRIGVDSFQVDNADLDREMARG